MNFFVVRTLDDGSYQCKSDDGSLDMVLAADLFPVVPYRSQSFNIIYDEVNYKIEVAPACPECHPEIKQRIRDRVKAFVESME